MDVTITSTGKTFYRIDDGVAAMLCEAFPEAFQRTNAPADRVVSAPAATVKFGLKQMPTSGEWVVQATDDRTTLYFTGSSTQLATHDFWLCGKANRAPAELIEAYRAARKRDYPVLKGDQIMNNPYEPVVILYYGSTQPVSVREMRLAALWQKPCAAIGYSSPGREIRMLLGCRIGPPTMS